MVFHHTGPTWFVFLLHFRYLKFQQIAVLVRRWEGIFLYFGELCLMLFSRRVGGNLISVGFGENHASAIFFDMIDSWLCTPCIWLFAQKCQNVYTVLMSARLQGQGWAIVVWIQQNKNSVLTSNLWLHV